MMCNNCSSIRFQNPSYDRGDEVEVILNSAASDIAPGQHEYVNPIDDKFLKVSSNFTFNLHLDARHCFFMTKSYVIIFI